MPKRSRMHACAISAVLLFACAKKGQSPDPEAAQNPDLATMNLPPPSTPTSPAEDYTGTVGVAPTTDPGTPSSPMPGPGTIGTSGPESRAGTEGTMETGGATASPTMMGSETLSDAQIAKITETVDTGEVEQARLAQKKAKNQKVKKYAQHMISTHTQSKNKNARVLKKAQLEPEDSATAQNLDQRTTETMTRLEMADQTDFDRRYIDAQVEQHQTVVNLLDQKLIPSAQNPELKKRLEEARAMVEEHLKQAREIQQALVTADASGATPTP